ncbi:hypothetical protein Tco_0703455 [Tanacetum coccineum]|uniref:Uncharacterized protein n=1 Tax=Tanacetum coccineum TaxID=301880 RepID=A0ABQ4XYV3_9ASTR
MVKMVPYEAFACPCGDGMYFCGESYKPKTRWPLEDTLRCKFFYGKTDESVLFGSPGASTTPIYSPGSSSTLIYSPGSSTPPRYSPGASTPQSYSLGTSIPQSYSLGTSTPQSYSLGTSRNAKCSNCKHLLDR